MAKKNEAEEKNYEDMSEEELEAVLAENSAKREALLAEGAAIHAILDVKIANRTVRAKVERMSDPEKRALLQVLQTDGIPGGEAIGGSKTG